MTARQWARCAQCGLATYVCAKRGCPPRQPYVLTQRKGAHNARHDSSHQTLADVSREWQRLRDAWEVEVGAGVRADAFPTGFVTQGSKRVGYVSWNGRVWAGGPKAWHPDTVLLQEAVRAAPDDDSDPPCWACGSPAGVECEASCEAEIERRAETVERDRDARENR